MNLKPMSVLGVLLVATLGGAPAVLAQNAIYRCGNEYTNNANQARERGCKLVEGSNVTVVEGTRPAAGGASAGAPAKASSPAGAPKVSANDQRARDADARAILETELRKAQARRDELVKEYNNGAPERSALELRNVQKYQERIAELKASIARSESDIEGIQRELSRLPPKP
ncbi:MAG: hypothetical protein LC097_08850 [Burkholderiales bacterium]|nr:hypothetical protein [Burkholderiales bacterium]